MLPVIERDVGFCNDRSEAKAADYLVSARSRVMYASIELLLFLLLLAAYTSPSNSAKTQRIKTFQLMIRLIAVAVDRLGDELTKLYPHLGHVVYHD